jgi:predicted phosphodiesterase
MNIAIFSDIHGKFILPFMLVDIYQKETQNKIDLILQCGDMGAYPDISNMDRATLKHAKYDRDELGFSDYFMTKNNKIEDFLTSLDINMVCVRGNHEDHDFLDELELKSEDSRFSIDCYQKVWVCKSGWIQEFKKGDEIMRYVGIGRIGDRKGRSDSKYIQDYEMKMIKKLYKSKDDFDILITHDQSTSRSDNYGMKEINDLLNEIPFKQHFYGHTGQPFFQSTDSNGITNVIKISELEFDETGIVNPSSMMVWSSEKNEIEVVSSKIINQITKHNWKHLIL